MLGSRWSQGGVGFFWGFSDWMIFGFHKSRRPAISCGGGSVEIWGGGRGVEAPLDFHRFLFFLKRFVCCFFYATHLFLGQCSTPKQPVELLNRGIFNENPTLPGSITSIPKTMPCFEAGDTSLKKHVDSFWVSMLDFGGCSLTGFSSTCLGFIWRNGFLP